MGPALGSSRDRAMATGPRAATGWTEAPVGLAKTWLTEIDSVRSTTWAVGDSLLAGFRDTRPLALRRVDHKWVSTPTPVQTFAAPSVDTSTAAGT
jgi:hypothetical protein